MRSSFCPKFKKKKKRILAIFQIMKEKSVFVHYSAPVFYCVLVMQIGSKLKLSVIETFLKDDFIYESTPRFEEKVKFLIETFFRITFVSVSCCQVALSQIWQNWEMRKSSVSFNLQKQTVLHLVAKY